MRTLVKNSSGRWCIAEPELTCGSSLVAYIPGKGWVLGRVEFSDEKKDYYFLCESQKITQVFSENLEVRTVDEQIALENECTGESVTAKLLLKK